MNSLELLDMFDQIFLEKVYVWLVSSGKPKLKSEKKSPRVNLFTFHVEAQNIHKRDIQVDFA